MVFWSVNENKPRIASTIAQAARAARSYLWSELDGIGLISYFDYETTYERHPLPFRIDERTFYTDFKWKVLNLY